jgi:hypothetical protein
MALEPLSPLNSLRSLRSLWADDDSCLEGGGQIVQEGSELDAGDRATDADDHGLVDLLKSERSGHKAAIWASRTETTASAVAS